MVLTITEHKIVSLVIVSDNEHIQGLLACL